VTRVRARTAIASTILAALTGCASCDSVPQNAVTDCNQSAVGIGSVKTDILFVVDDSGSMSVHQQNLATNFQTFIQSLAASPVKNDIQIGITTSSVDVNDPSDATTPYRVLSTFDPTSCNTTPRPGPTFPAGALLKVDPVGVQSTAGPGRILAGDSPTLVPDFIQNVTVGSCGSSKEQPLRAMQLALSEPLLSGANAGLLRSGARLAVVVVSDDNDCSDPGYLQGGVRYANVPSTYNGTNYSTEGANCQSYSEPVDDFVKFLQTAVGGEVRDTVLAVIGSFDPVTLAPSRCYLLDANGNPTTTRAEAAAPRNKALATGFGANAIQASICSNSFHDALQTLADYLVPQTFPLDGTPADWRMLAVSRVRAGVTTGCPLALAGTPEAATAGAVYTPPQGGAPTITMQPACTLAVGDAVQIHVACIR
jgi:hypothetical protein